MEKVYELCVLFGGNQTDAEIEKLSESVEGLLKEANVETKFSASLGKRKLAYPIAGHTGGEYRVWYFVVAGEAIPPLGEKLRLASTVTRHLLSALAPKIAESRIAKIKDGKGAVTETEERAPVRRRTHERPAEAPKTETIERRAEPARVVPKTSLEDLDKKLDEILESDKL